MDRPKDRLYLIYSNVVSLVKKKKRILRIISDIVSPVLLIRLDNTLNS